MEVDCVLYLCGSDEEDAISEQETERDEGWYSSSSKVRRKDSTAAAAGLGGGWQS
jgi:hypothetical protein